MLILAFKYLQILFENFPNSALDTLLCWSPSRTLRHSVADSATAGPTYPPSNARTTFRQKISINRYICFFLSSDTYFSFGQLNQRRCHCCKTGGRNFVTSDVWRMTISCVKTSGHNNDSRIEHLGKQNKIQPSSRKKKDEFF